MTTFFEYDDTCICSGFCFKKTPNGVLCLTTAHGFTAESDFQAITINDVKFEYPKVEILNMGNLARDYSLLLLKVEIDIEEIPLGVFSPEVDHFEVWGAPTGKWYRVPVIREIEEKNIPEVRYLDTLRDIFPHLYDGMVRYTRHVLVVNRGRFDLFPEFADKPRKELGNILGKTPLISPVPVEFVAELTGWKVGRSSMAPEICELYYRALGIDAESRNEVAGYYYDFAARVIKGDSGGPMMGFVNGNRVLLGVTSQSLYGEGICCHLLTEDALQEFELN